MYSYTSMLAWHAEGWGHMWYLWLGVPPSTYLSHTQSFTFLPLSFTSTSLPPTPHRCSYFCVAVLKHLEPGILRHTQEQGLLVFLKEGGVAGFHAAQWLDFMTQLRDKFGSTVQRSLYEFFHLWWQRITLATCITLTECCTWRYLDIQVLAAYTTWPFKVFIV